MEPPDDISNPIDYTISFLQYNSCCILVSDEEARFMDGAEGKTLCLPRTNLAARRFRQGGGSGPFHQQHTITSVTGYHRLLRQRWVLFPSQAAERAATSQMDHVVDHESGPDTPTAPLWMRAYGRHRTRSALAAMIMAVPQVGIGKLEGDVGALSSEAENVASSATYSVNPPA